MAVTRDLGTGTYFSIGTYRSFLLKSLSWPCRGPTIRPTAQFSLGPTASSRACHSRNQHLGFGYRRRQRLETFPAASEISVTSLRPCCRPIRCGSGVRGFPPHLSGHLPSMVWGQLFHSSAAFIRPYLISLDESFVQQTPEPVTRLSIDVALIVDNYLVDINCPFGGYPFLAHILRHTIIIPLIGSPITPPTARY